MTKREPRGNHKNHKRHATWSTCTDANFKDVLKMKSYLALNAAASKIWRKQPQCTQDFLNWVSRGNLLSTIPMKRPRRVWRGENHDENTAVEKVRLTMRNKREAVTNSWLWIYLVYRDQAVADFSVYLLLRQRLTDGKKFTAHHRMAWLSSVKWISKTRGSNTSLAWFPLFLLYRRTTASKEVFYRTAGSRCQDVAKRWTRQNDWQVRWWPEMILLKPEVNVRIPTNLNEINWPIRKCSADKNETAWRRRAPTCHSPNPVKDCQYQSKSNWEPTQEQLNPYQWEKMFLTDQQHLHNSIFLFKK